MQRFRFVYTTIFAAVLSLGLTLFVLVGTASAHAKVISATPGIGSTIATPPTVVSVHTAENMNPDPRQSNLFVYGPNGDLISQGNAKIPLNNPQEMSIQIKPQGSGIYIVRWITLSADDGDPDQGAFVFTVRPGATASKAATGTASPSTTSTSGGSFPVVPVVLAGVIALLVGGGAGFGLGRRGMQTTVPATSETPSSEKVTTKNP